MRGSHMVAVLGFIPQALQWVELCPSKVTFAWNLKCGLMWKWGICRYNQGKDRDVITLD